jgi:diguanylate cyclase (GGDEF)-like protein
MTPQADDLKSSLSSPGKEIRRLRLYFFLSLIVAILIAEIVPIAGVYRFAHRGADSRYLRISAINLYNDTIDQYAHALQTILAVFLHDDRLRDGLARGDRQALLEHAAPIYASMMRTFDITHLYFTGPDRVNLLRVHDPGRFGDVIDRVTTLTAERTREPVSGVEFGPIGTLTLRVVTPWFEENTGRLLGYVELGIDTFKVVERIRQSVGAHAFVLVRKEFLDRSGWEEGMRVSGRTPDWNRLPNSVIYSQSLPQIPPELAERFVRSEMETAADEPLIQIKQRLYRPLFIPLQDVRGRDVATVAFLIDISEEAGSVRLALLLGAIAGGLLPFILFFHLAGRFRRRIAADEQKLKQLVTLDELTGLYNNRMYYSLLAGEILRAQPQGRPISVLLLDIDHLEDVNDEHGHPAGDRVLERLGRLLKEFTPSGNSVCRYGGGEFTIILPELGVEVASEMAERLREVIERTDFDIGQDRRIKITVSIGVAAFPEAGGAAEDLTRAAELALYTAEKEGRNRVSRYKKPATAVVNPEPLR